MDVVEMVLNTIECKATDKKIEGIDGSFMDCKMYLFQDGKEVVIDVEDVFRVDTEGTSFSVMSGKVGDEDVIWIKPADQINSFFKILDRTTMKATFPKQGKDIIIGLKKE